MLVAWGQVEAAKVFPGSVTCSRVLGLVFGSDEVFGNLERRADQGEFLAWLRLDLGSDAS
jgi:hypothetical protein